MTYIKKKAKSDMVDDTLYHIYAKDKCLYPCLRETEFKVKWAELNQMVGVMKTDYTLEDLSFDYQIPSDPTTSESKTFNLEGYGPYTLPAGSTAFDLEMDLYGNILPQIELNQFYQKFMKILEFSKK